MLFRKGRYIIFKMGGRNCGKSCTLAQQLRKKGGIMSEKEKIEHIKELITELRISDIEPWSTYEIDGAWLFRLQDIVYCRERGEQ